MSVKFSFWPEQLSENITGLLMVDGTKVLMNVFKQLAMSHSPLFYYCLIPHEHMTSSPPVVMDTKVVSSHFPSVECITST